MGEGKKLQIRNSTIDFLVFTKDAEEKRHRGKSAGGYRMADTESHRPAL